MLPKSLLRIVGSGVDVSREIADATDGIDGRRSHGVHALARRRRNLALRANQRAKWPGLIWGRHARARGKRSRGSDGAPSLELAANTSRWGFVTKEESLVPTLNGGRAMSVRGIWPATGPRLSQSWLRGMLVGYAAGVGFCASIAVILAAYTWCAHGPNRARADGGQPVASKTAPADATPPEHASVPIAKAGRLPSSETQVGTDQFALSPSAVATAASFVLPEKPWFALADLTLAEPESCGGAAKVCSVNRSLDTALTWARSPAEAADLASREGKLVFLIHVSGNFEDPGFT